MGTPFRDPKWNGVGDERQVVYLLFAAGHHAP